MRVLLDKTGQPVQLKAMSDAAYASTMALVRTGDLALVPDRAGVGVLVAEPIEGYDDDEMSAQRLREKLASDNPGHDYRVILNADL